MADPPVLKRVSVTFSPEGAIEYAVSYEHTDDPPSPTGKQRLTRAARMAALALAVALERLDAGEKTWGGFATNTRQSEDRIVVEQKERKL